MLNESQPIFRRSLRTLLGAAPFLLVVACGGASSEPAKSPEGESGPVAATATTDAGHYDSTIASTTPGATPAGATGDTMPSNANGASMGSGAVSANNQGSTASTDSSVAAGVAAAKLSDGAIAQILDTANTGEIEQGRYAASHAKRKDVKNFAQHMVSAHTDNGSTLKATLKSENITLTASNENAQMQSDGAKTLDSIKTISADAFDRAYIDAQVKEHQDLLDALDNKFIPNAQDAKFKARLQTVRSMVEKHLKDAKSIQSSLP